MCFHQVAELACNKPTVRTSRRTGAGVTKICNAATVYRIQDGRAEVLALEFGCPQHSNLILSKKEVTEINFALEKEFAVTITDEFVLCRSHINNQNC